MSENPKHRADLLITHASELLTCVPSGSDLVGRIHNGAVAIAGERIVAVGATDEVLWQVDATGAQVIDATGKIVAPGFVDCHTHLVFGGSRVQEYAARMTHTPDEVKAMGIPMGILASVNTTRAESALQLLESSKAKLHRLFRYGTTTVESKSGYGLTLDDELKILAVNQQLKDLQPIDVVSTFLGAHAFPPELPREAYVQLIIDEMIPRVADEKLATFCDVFCDEGYFSADESRRILEAGQRAGLLPKMHTEQYSAIGGAQVAAELRVVSADHLNYADRAAIHALRDAGVVGVVTPVLDFAVKHPRPFDARAMLDEGLTIALATDFCPACWVESMQVVMQFACRQYRISPEEALYTATVGGAKALGLNDRGALAPGMLADMQIWDLPTFEDVIYRIGHNAVETVIKRGKVFQNP